jgi:methionyl-tRNA formyltransferase
VGAVFLGTPAAAIPSLAALAGVEDVDLVITQPDRPSGRSRTAAPGPVSVAARQWGIPVAQPADTAELTDLLVHGAFRFGLVVAYGRILTPAMLASTDAGFLNVHFSLLPRWRGAAPVERAIAAGDERTGVTLMRLDEGLDTGPVIGEVSTPIGSKETGGSLTARLSYLGGTLVDTALPDYLSGRRRPVPQIETDTSHARRLTKAEAQLDPTWSADRAERAVRAFHPRPTAWFATGDGVLRIVEARPAETDVAPGTVQVLGDAVLAGFSDGSIRLVRVQQEGRQPMDARAWMNGRRGEPAHFDPQEA